MDNRKNLLTGKPLKETQAIPSIPGWNGLFAGPDKKVLITGDPLTSVSEKKVTIPCTNMFAPSAGQSGIKGDDPIFFNELYDDDEVVTKNKI